MFSYKILGIGAMVQWLRAPAPLAEDLSLIHSTNVAAYNLLCVKTEESLKTHGPYNLADTTLNNKKP